MASLPGSIDEFRQIVRRQGYSSAYEPQNFPLIGGIVSIPTVLVSGVMAVVKACDAVWQRVYYGTPFFPQPNEDSNQYHPMTDAIDLGIIFINNVLNICTAGCLNSAIALITLLRMTDDYLDRIDRHHLPH